MDPALNTEKKKYIDTYRFLLLCTGTVTYNPNNANPWSSNINYDKYFATISFDFIKSNTTFSVDTDNDYYIIMIHPKTHKIYTLNPGDYIDILLAKNKIVLDDKNNNAILSVPIHLSKRLSSTDRALLLSTL